MVISFIISPSPKSVENALRPKYLYIPSPSVVISLWLGLYPFFATLLLFGTRILQTESHSGDVPFAHSVQNQLILAYSPHSPKYVSPDDAFLLYLHPSYPLNNTVLKHPLITR